MRIRNFLLAVSVMGMAFVPACGAAWAHKVALDAGLYASYTAAQDGSNVIFSVCGRLPDTFGCYGGGRLEPFEHACAVLEGSPSTKRNVVTRAIYVLDRRLSIGDPMILYVFSRADTITDEFDNVALTLTAQVPLGISAGDKSHCSMVANHRFVYAGTEKSAATVTIDKSSFAVSDAVNGGLISLTADERGYVSVTTQFGFLQFDPQGNEAAVGGGRQDFVNSRSAWILK